MQAQDLGVRIEAHPFCCLLFLTLRLAAACFFSPCCLLLSQPRRTLLPLLHGELRALQQAVLVSTFAALFWHSVQSALLRLLCMCQVTCSCGSF
jgi:hypothetical protein